MVERWRGRWASWAMMVVEKEWAVFVDDAQIKRRHLPTLDLGVIDSVPLNSGSIPSG